MRLGLFTVLYPELDLESLVGMAQRLGCTALELSLLPGRGLRISILSKLNAVPLHANGFRLC